MPLHIKGDANPLTDIPSQSFESVPSWRFQTNNNLQKIFNSMFPLPETNSWTVVQLHPDVAMKVISILQMQHFTLDAWRQLPKIGKVTGPIGKDMLQLWELTITYRTRHSLGESELLPDSLQELEKEPLVKVWCTPTWIKNS
jgi:hypothetical protein